MRMDRYKEYDEKENLEKENVVLSREVKNQDMYKDVYMNSSLVDINNLFDNEDKEEDLPIEQNEIEIETYQEKSYDVNDYLEKAHEIHKIDDAKRNLEDEDFLETEDQIKKLIANIEEKEQEEDIFSELRGDNEDTMIGAKLKTDEFDTNIFLTLLEDDISNENMSLSHALGEETVYNLQAEEEKNIDYTFEKIIENDKIMTHKIKKLPLIIFIITLVMLIVVVIVILLK